MYMINYINIEFYYRYPIISLHLHDVNVNVICQCNIKHYCIVRYYTIQYLYM